MGHLLYLIFRCDGNVMESDVFVGVFGGSKRGLGGSSSSGASPRLVHKKHACKLMLSFNIDRASI